MNDQDWPGTEWPGTEDTSETQPTQSSGDQWPGTEWPGTEEAPTQAQRPQPEGALATGVRAGARALPGVAGGVVGWGAGAEAGGALGAEFGSTMGPVGTLAGSVIGGIGGALVGGYLANKAASAAKEAVGFDDDAQMAADAEEHPTAAMVGELAPMAATLSPAGGAKIAERAVAAGVGGAFEAGQELYNDGSIDPTKLAATGALFAAMPRMNRYGAAASEAGAKVARGAGKVAGRPGVRANPEAAPAQDEAESSQQATVTGETSFQQPAPQTTGETTGNPQSAPERSARAYPKGAQPDSQPAGSDPLTQGQMTPDVAQALQAAQNPDVEASLTAFKAAANGTAIPEGVDVAKGTYEGERIPIKTGIEEAAAGQPQPAPTGPAKPVEVVRKRRRPQPQPTPEPAPVAAAPVSDQRYVNEMAGYPGGIKPPPRTPEQQAQTLEKLRALKAKMAAENTPPVETGLETAPVAAAGDTFQPGQRWSKEGTEYHVQDVSPDGKMAKIKFRNGETATAHYDAEVANGWTPVETRSESVPEAPIETGLETAPTPDVPGKMEGGNEPVAEGGWPGTEMPGDEHPTNKIDREKINVNPSDAQKEAGNYEKAPVRVMNREAKVETPEGATRRSKSTDKVQWENVSPYDYGHFLRTVGADGDPIDVAIGKGDKHFIVDQRDADTGKFDEHKVFSHFADAHDAMEKYEKGFSDDRGQDRLQAITEVTPEQFRAWADDLKKNPAKRKLSYAEYAGKEPTGPSEGVKPEPKVVTAAVKQLRDAGKGDLADQLMAMEPSKRLGAASKVVNGTTKELARPNRIRGEAPVVEGITADDGSPITARSKGDAAAKSADVKTMNDAYAKIGDVGIPTTPEEKAELRQRLQAFVDETKDVKYRPAVKHEPYLMARAVRKLLLAKNPTDKSWTEFASTAKQLAEGGAKDVRQGQRIESDIGRSRRSGDEAIATAEAKSAGTNNIEDAMLDKIDRERAGYIDVPEEEAEDWVPKNPVKTVEDIKKNQAPKGAPLDLSKPADQQKLYDATERAKLAAKTQAELKRQAPEKPSEERAASEGRRIDPKSLGADYMNNLLERAAKPRSGSRLDAAEIVDAARKAGPTKGGVPQVIRALANDDSGMLNLPKIIDDLRKLKSSAAGYFAHIPEESYIARKATGTRDRLARSISDKFHITNQADIQHLADIAKFAAAVPKEMRGDAQQRMYFTREAGKTNLLPAEEKAWYDANLKSIYDANDKLYDNINEIDPKRLGPKVEGDHVYRIPDREVNKLEQADNVARDHDPVQGIGVSPKGTMLPRKFVSLTDTAGNRFLISPHDEGFTVWHNRKPINIKDPTFAYKAGETIDVGGRKFTMHDATTPEIEQHALFDDGKPAKYIHDATLSALRANYTLGTIARHLQLINEIKTDPDFLRYATPPGEEAPSHYKTTKLSNFKDWKMEPQLAWALDDAAQAGINSPPINFLRGVSQAILKTIFFNPVAHLLNVAGHWAVERGWEWVKPGAYKRLATTGMKAIKSVVTQDDLQRELRQHGAGTIYGGIVTQGVMDNVAKGLGYAIQKAPTKWEAIAQKAGLGNAAKLVDAVYKASSRVMWAGNDMFLTQAVLEHMDKGLSMKDAITQAERHIPNYRVPSTVMGSKEGARYFAQFLTEPAVTAFGRYHWAMWNSYANTIKDLRGNGAAKVDAAGHLFVMGLMAFAMYPLLDKMAQVVTGNDKASANRRGPMSIPSHVAGSLQGKEDISAAARATFPLSPVITTAMDLLTNKDFRGKDIIERGDVQRAAQGNLHAAGNVVKQGAGFLGRSLVAPLGTAASAAAKGEGPAATIRDQILDIKNPSAKANKYDANSTRYNMQNARKREKSGELY